MSSLRREDDAQGAFTVLGRGYGNLLNALVYEEGLGNRQDPILDHPLPSLLTEFSNTDMATEATPVRPPIA
jgi:hypothetical protein